MDALQDSRYSLKVPIACCFSYLALNFKIPHLNLLYLAFFTKVLKNHFLDPRCEIRIVLGKSGQTEAVKD